MPGHEMTQGAIEMIMRAFRAHGISIHIDNGNMNGGTVIPHDDVTTWAEFVGTGSDYKNINSNNHIYGLYFTDERVGIFHYAVFGHVDESNWDGYSLELKDNAFWISDINMNPREEDQAQTFMHELGHSFGLNADNLWESRNVDSSGNPNDPIDDAIYPSVMRYGYDILGYSVIDYSDRVGTGTFYLWCGGGKWDIRTISLNDWEIIIANIGVGLWR